MKTQQIKKKHIFVIANDKEFLKQIKNAKLDMPIEFNIQTGAYEALQELRLSDVNMVLVDYDMPLVSGTELVRLIRKDHPTIPILVIARAISHEEMREITRAGAVDFIFTPMDIQVLKEKVDNLFFTEAYHYQVSALTENLKKNFGLDQIIGDCEEMWKVFHAIRKISGSDVTVFINGESGTGKELFAKAIHRSSPRKNRPMVVINCAAIPENLLESELFGHEKGAFSGAISQRTGKFELADKGTIFLDEIGEMSLFTQSKILRMLEEQEFERVGGNKTIKVDVRIITATNKNLEEEVKAGRFREDLYYRINVYPIVLPPLREREEDIPLLAYFFTNVLGTKNNKEIVSITQDALELLKNYAWPGNIRELENVIERAILNAPGRVLTVHEFASLKDKPEIRKTPLYDSSNNGEGNLFAEGKIYPLKDTERMAIEQALRINEGNISLTAKKLQVGRATLHRKIKEYNLDIKEIKSSH